MRFLCQPCNHRWWQHRHPEARIRYAGLALMASGALTALGGLLAVCGR